MDGELISEDELDRRFSAHPVDSEKMEDMGKVRQAMRTAAVQVVWSVPESRERDIALAKLEEAMWWANAAIAREGI